MSVGRPSRMSVGRRAAPSVGWPSRRRPVVARQKFVFGEAISAACCGASGARMLCAAATRAPQHTPPPASSARQQGHTGRRHPVAVGPPAVAHVGRRAARAASRVARVLQKIQ
jgi:hypothetical protein